MKKYYDSEYFPSGGILNKPYFTKYLPVEGEIKQFDKVLINGGIDIVERYPFVDPYIWEGGYNILLAQQGTQRVENVKLAKLFLCSRDIQVGDKFRTDIFDGESTCTGVKDGFVYNGSSVRVSIGNCFKVVGEVSPKAIWVKEGMEFDEEEIYRDVLIKDTFDNEYYHYHPKGNEPFNLGTTDKLIHDIIKIKCPTCGRNH
jgi:hypothetical protein